MPAIQQAIRDAVHGDLSLSREIYGHVDSIARKLGADESAQVPFEKYARAAESLLKPSSAARAIMAGAPVIERVDLLVQQISRTLGMEHPEIDRTVATVNAALERDEIAETVARIEPGFPQYARMREILADYRELALLDLPRVPEVDVVHPGDEYAGTAELRSLLIALGDLDAGTTAAGMTYDSVLAAGVERFQARHGLEVDGIIGKGTFTELNTPLTDRVNQIELALELEAAAAAADPRISAVESADAADSMVEASVRSWVMSQPLTPAWIRPSTSR